MKTETLAKAVVGTLGFLIIYTLAGNTGYSTAMCVAVIIGGIALSMAGFWLPVVLAEFKPTLALKLFDVLALGPILIYTVTIVYITTNSYMADNLALFGN